MKIAFTTSGKDLDSPLTKRFGRADHFLVYEVGRGNFEIIENKTHQDLSQGVGIQSAQTLVNLGVHALITGQVGPKASRVLAAGHVKVYPTDMATIAEALEAYRLGKLSEN